MAEDKRDIRVRIDLCFDPKQKAKADQLKALIEPFLAGAVVINEILPNEERGYIDVERCGHRLGLACDKVERWEVKRGKVIEIQPIPIER